MTLTIEIRDFEALFRYPDQYADVVEEFDDLLERRESGRLRGKRYLGPLEKLVEQHPWFIDGHAHIGNYLHGRGEFACALQAYERGYAVGTAALPADFMERIPWTYLDNRPFLRAAHGIALCQSRLGRHARAISMMERILIWIPHDNLGVRFLIGSDYLREGMDEKAMRWFESASEYPPYLYERALLLLRQGRFVEAATSLRQGFVDNGYIAEALCGNQKPQPLAVWHNSSWGMPEEAMDYVLGSGQLWHQTRNAIAFLRWLYLHPRVMAERAGILQWQEALQWEQDPRRRSSLSSEAHVLREAIDDRLSEEIVVERTDPYGQAVLPWLYSDRRH